MTDALAELLADISAALDGRLANMLVADLVRDVSRENISAAEVADILRRFEVARSGLAVENDAPVASVRMPQ